MKTSNKILLTVSILPIIFIIGLIVSLRIGFENRTYPDETVRTSKKRVIREFNFSDFRKISVGGVWDLKIFQGSDYYIGISAPENVMGSIIVEKKGDQLVLDYLQDNQNLDGDSMPKATFMVPSVSTINLWGSCRLDLSEFNTDYLSIAADGKMKMTAWKASITNLNLVSQGVSEWDLSQASVVNARVSAGGTFSIILRMNGGRLSGALDGIGTLTYTGAADISDMKKKNPMSQIVYRKTL